MDAPLRYLEHPGADPFRAALEPWRRPGGLVLGLLAEGDAACLGELQKACEQVGLGLVGGIFPGLVAEGAVGRRGACLAALPPGTRHGLVGNLGPEAASPETAARRLAEAIGDPSGAEGDVLVLLFDAQVADIASILGEIYVLLGDGYRYFGACAGSETFEARPCLFDGDVLMGGGAAWFVLPTGARTALAHGYEEGGESLSASSTSGNRILRIDWKPAFAAYREEVRKAFGIDLTRENFYDFAVHYPLGISLAAGRSLVRIPVAAEETGAVVCVGEVPENSLLTMLRAPQVDSRGAVEAVVAALGRPGEGEVALLFYCAGRRLHLGEAAGREVTALNGALGMPVIGALSLGEAGSLDGGGYPYFHNACLAGALWRGLSVP